MGFLQIFKAQTNLLMDQHWKQNTRGVYDMGHLSYQAVEVYYSFPKSRVNPDLHEACIGKPRGIKPQHIGDAYLWLSVNETNYLNLFHILFRQT